MNEPVFAAVSAVPSTWTLPVAFANRPVPPAMVLTPEKRIVVGPVGTAVPCDVANSWSPFAVVHTASTV